jgi:sorbitol-6-phosphate 2-dehydrogenase
MNDQLIQIIPAVRMLVSRKRRVLAGALPAKSGNNYDTAQKLLQENGNRKAEEIMELPHPDTETFSIREYFDHWFSTHNDPPAFVTIKGIGAIVISVPSDSGKVLSGKIIIVTGAGQGFGAGIAEILHEKGASVVIADINEVVGKNTEESLNSKALSNRALYVNTDVSNPESVHGLIQQTVWHLGGLDCMISNAGILRAGGLDEITPEIFRFMTEVNYTGFFLCAKYAAAVMKIQTAIAPDTFCDIIQINSKSGLRGSKKNFTYAGGKFGGIGLTQSFALELMPYNIKVNAVCPGNYFEGPLWSDPETGLFNQYLKAGKVSGARTIQDVRNHYEKQVPAGRGCKVEDVVKAVLYAIDQEYETGQAIPVTGGQIMLH